MNGWMDPSGTAVHSHQCVRCVHNCRTYARHTEAKSQVYISHNQLITKQSGLSKAVLQRPPVTRSRSDRSPLGCGGAGRSQEEAKQL